MFLTYLELTHSHPFTPYNGSHRALPHRASGQPDLLRAEASAGLYECPMVRRRLDRMGRPLGTSDRERSAGPQEQKVMLTGTHRATHQDEQCARGPKNEPNGRRYSPHGGAADHHTDQTHCYDESDIEIPCSGSGQDAEFKQIYLLPLQ